MYTKIKRSASIFYRIISVSLLMFAMSLFAGNGSVVTIHPNSISVATSISGARLIELRVAGPGGFHANRQSDTGALDWYPGDLTDGEYRYEVFVTVGEEPPEGAADNTRLYRENGRFEVANGLLKPLSENDAPPLPLPEGSTGMNSSTWFEKIATGLLDFLVTPAAAANLTTNPGDVYITDTTPTIFWDDTSTAGVDWLVYVDEFSYGIYDQAYLKYTVFAQTNSGFGLWLYPDHFTLKNLTSNENTIYLHTDSGANVLNADSNGDIQLADGAVFVDKSANFLGVGTMTPTQELHVLSANPSLLLDDTSGGDLTITNDGGEISFGITNGSHNGTIVTFENDLTTGMYPGVGIWEANPDVPLHVGSHDGMSAGLLVQNTVAPTAAGDVSMFRLENTGDKIVRFAIQAGGGNAIWTFDNEPTYNGGAGVNSGRFRIAKSGTGVAEFSVDGYGNGRLYGNSYAVNHVNTSSREAKTDFKALDERDVLDKLMRLSVSEWRYKQEDRETRHIGPVAEDFRQVFGLGDGRHISTVDSEGIALAAIKAIKTEKDAEIAALRRENRLLAEELQTLKEKEKETAGMAKRLEALEELLLGKQQISSKQ